ncbi:unnamed protein product [Mytilus coruscus]|uniref:C-type lectin domain-containing protein n=1 Tax=Mytilus coruscus TaxID=42192 RepID=A0A6J8CT38_MYTCO|nr:unnamed protein product [Mytilus coruscus]
MNLLKDVVCFVFFFVYIEANGEVKQIHFTVEKDRKLMNLGYFVDNVKSDTTCAAICSRDNNCFSASYYEEAHLCGLSLHGDAVTAEWETGWSLLRRNGAGCDSGWLRYGTSCYLISLTPMDYIDGLNYCAGNNSELLTIFDQKENHWIVQSFTQFPNISNQYVRTAGVRTQNTTQSSIFVWKTSEGEDIPLTYENWNNFEPSGPVGEADCLALDLNLNGKWSDITCTGEHMIVCKK